MNPTPVTSIEIHVVERTLVLEVAGARRALARCGYWPISGTLDQYAAVIDRASREVGLTHEIERRDRRRFGHPTNAIALERLFERRSVATSLLDQRCDNLSALLGPAEGEA